MAAETVYMGIYGGPGMGKSTLAAEAFVQMRKQLHPSISVELCVEYAKDCVFSDHLEQLEKYQFKVITEQVYRLERLYGKADIVVTDGPILLNVPYVKGYEYARTFIGWMEDMHHLRHWWNYLLTEAPSKYVDSNRRRTESWSMDMHEQIVDYVTNNLAYCPGTYDQLLEAIMMNAKVHVAQSFGV